jgi:DNA topoisomerase-1
MKLVIVESPAKCKTIKKYLGSGYEVLASFGHICDLPSKNGSVLPEEDFAMDYQISSKSTKHIKAIVDAMKKSDTLYLATDPDREGEAISWHVLETLKKKRAIKKDTVVRRISFNEITKKAVLSAIANPRDLDMDLVNAQQARRALDYLVGFTLSPILWRKLPGSRSAGRVQSVALRLISDRENEIELFRSQEYWDIKLDLDTPEKENFTARITHIEGKKLEQFDINNEAQAKEITAALKTKQYQVSDVEKKEVKRNPRPPFTTSSLQQEAARKLGFGAKRTMMVAQQLYEGINGESGLITYMRTDGVTVSEDAITQTRDVIKNEFGASYVPSTKRVYKTKAKNAQEAHEAIRPTDIARMPEQMRHKLENDQFRLYELIWKRLVASQMSSAVLDQVAANIKTNDNYAAARATGSSIKFKGFYTLYMESRDDGDGDEKNTLLPPLSKNDHLALNEADPNQHFTQPPPRFSEASLVKNLEEMGIGRPSTYASIISVLQEREYVKLDKKRFIPESRGRIVTAFLHSFFEKYVEYDFTANLEEELDRVSDGKLDWKQVLREFWDPFISNIDQVKEKDITTILDTLDKLLEIHIFATEEDGTIDRKCPKCDGGELHLKLGKFGAFKGCSNYPECKYVSQISGAGVAGSSDSGGKEDRCVGLDDSGTEVFVKYGPYGPYLQLGHQEKDSKEKPKRSPIPKEHKPEEIDMEAALQLLSLPKRIGTHPETDKVIVAGIGRFGPYIRHDSKYVSLKNDDDVLTIGINRAVVLIAENATKGSKEPLKTLGQHDKKDVNIFDGRYGPYIKYGKDNIKIPKEKDMDSLTLEEAIELIAAKQPEKKKPAKKTAAKKTAAKKPTKKKSS